MTTCVHDSFDGPGSKALCFRLTSKNQSGITEGEWAFLVASGATFATAIIIALFMELTGGPIRRKSLQAQQQIDQLKRENSALTANLSQSSESLAADQREIQNLHAQLGTVATTAENLATQQ